VVFPDNGISASIYSSLMSENYITIPEIPRQLAPIPR